MGKSLKAIQSEQTRARLICEATSLFARKGYFATSIADLATAADLTKGAIYHHFVNKEAIFFAVIENIRATWESTVAQRVGATKTAKEAISALFEGHTILFRENEYFCLALNSMMMEMEGINPDFHEAMQSLYRGFMEFIMDILTKGQAAGEIRTDLDPQMMALTLIGTLRGSGCSRHIFERMGFDFLALMNTLKKIVTVGVEK